MTSTRDTPSSDDADDLIFRIQDFSTASPLEQLARQIGRILLKWKDEGILEPSMQSVDYQPHHVVVPASPIVREEVLPPLSSNTEYRLHYFSDSSVDVIPPKCSSSASSTSGLPTEQNTVSCVNGHSIQFYSGRVAQLHRWFGVYQYVVLSADSGAKNITSMEANW